MKTNVRRLLCLVLVLVLCFGLIPGVSAAEVDTPGTDIPTDVTEETDMTEEAAEIKQKPTAATKKQGIILLIIQLINLQFLKLKIKSVLLKMLKES